MSLTQRYENIIQGAVVLTGNTLNTRLNIAWPTTPGTRLFQTGTFITTNTALQVPSYPIGTTLNYLQNSSMAILNVIPGSTVVFAQLMWMMDNPPAGTSTNAVNFTTPAGTTSVTPTILETLTAIRFWRAADVTALVQAGVNVQPTNAQYIVGAVPSQSPPTNSTVGTAWGLYVVYQDNTLPLRYIRVDTGTTLVSSSQQLTYNFPGIVTPTSGPVKGYLLMNYSYGDLNDGAQIRVGATAGTAVQIGNTSNPFDGNSPYSRINNMMPANILNADTQDTNIGLLDTRGTFGTLNVDPYAGTAPPAARNLYDIAGYDISGQLTNNQTNLYTNITFVGSGSAFAQSQAVQVDMNAPKITPTKTVAPTTANVGDTLTYTISFTNTGTSNADNVVITDTIPTGATYQPATLNVVGNTAGTVTGPNPLVIPLTSSVIPGASVTITFDVVVTGIPGSSTMSNGATVGYTFVPGVGLTPVDVSVDTGLTANTIIINAGLVVTKTDSPDPVLAGNTLTYTLTVTNNGPSTADTVQLTDTVPTCLLLPTYTVDGIPQGAWTGTYDMGNMASGAFVQIVITGTVSPSCPTGLMTNTATVTSITPDPTPANRMTTITTQVNASADLVITKTASPDPVIAGQTLTYTLTMINNGPSDAQNVQVADIVPACLNSPTFTVDGTLIGIWTGGPYNLGTMIPGASRVVVITGTTDPGCL